MSVLTPRKIDNGNSIKYMGSYYQPYLNDEIKCFMPKTECLVIKAFNGDLLVTIDNKVYNLKKLSRNEKYSKQLDVIEEKIEKKKSFNPKTNLNWNVGEFKYQIKRAHREHQYA